MGESFGKCILCGSNRASLVQYGARHAPEAKIYRCASCGLVFLFPRQIQADLDRYYAATYHEEYGDPAIEERFRQDLEEACVRVKRLLPYLKPETRLLEVGSGSGAFLYAVRPYVAEAVGVEPDEAARGWLRQTHGFTLLEKIPPENAARAQFDLVVSFHVLEHVPDPVTFLAGLQKVLSPAGELVIEVPNVDDVLVGIYELPAYRQFYYQKAHLYYFSHQTLAMALEQAGYAATIAGVQRYDLSNHMRWMLTGQPGGHGYYGDILAPAVQAAYADALIRSGHADTLWGVARNRLASP